MRGRVGVAACASVVAGAAGVALGGGATAPAVARAPSSRASSSSARGLDVLPFPGTPDAAPGTNVYFPAVSPGQITAVRVVGSRSGVHAGRLRAQPDDQGTAFSPDRPFAAGERVSVIATLRSAKAGTASGAPGARRLRFSFSVARPARVTPSAKTAAPDASGRSAATSSRTHSFVTQPHFHMPWVRMSGKDTDTRSGYILIDSENAGQPAAYMVNGRGDLLWFKPSHPRGGPPAVFNVRVQRYRGRSVITYWHGRIVHGLGEGDDLILNSSYRTIHTVTAGDGYRKQGTDLHEFTLGREGSKAVAFVPIWSPVHANLTSVGGPSNGVVDDWIIQEIDLATNRVIWEWHALSHIPISDSYDTYASGQPYDYLHLNSIQQLPDGNILISARNTWAIYSIDKKTGRVNWELGGKHSSFHMGPKTNFEWQHDAALHGHGILTVFDDGFNGVTPEQSQSRALEMRLANHQATLVHAYTHDPPVLASSGGDVELLPNHNVFVGWGAAHCFSEYSRNGRQIFTASFVPPIESYRTFRAPWTGHPLWAPRIAVRRTSTAGHYNVYASWNGATQVRQWQVLVSNSSTGPFKPLKKVAWSSFETKVRVSTGDAYFEVQGLGKKGKLLAHGSSAAVTAGRG